MPSIISGCIRYSQGCISFEGKPFQRSLAEAAIVRIRVVVRRIEATSRKSAAKERVVRDAKYGKEEGEGEEGEAGWLSVTQRDN